MSYSVFMVLIIIVAILLILVIMVQNPKGGGLSSSFGESGGQSLGGVQQTSSFLDKSTWTLSIALLALVLLSNISAPSASSSAEGSSNIENTLDNREVREEALPTSPAPAAVEQDSAQ